MKSYRKDQYHDIFNIEDVDYLLNLPEVVDAKNKIDSKEKGSEYFYIDIPSQIQDRLKLVFNLDLERVHMRWIKGDTPSHIDRGVNTFDNTYLIYLTDSIGNLVLDGNNYPIHKNTGYVFSEGLSHETINTGNEPRLAVGPMSEKGLAVGPSCTLISVPQGTTVYIRQDGGDIQYSTDNKTSWNNITIYPICIENSTPSPTEVLKVEFSSDITFDNVGGNDGLDKYFKCTSSYIQFGSTSLNVDGSRPKITIKDVGGYLGLIQNGDDVPTNGHFNIYIYNLEVINDNSYLSDESGWICQYYFGYGVNNNYIINCFSDGTIGENCGGIVGAYAGNGGGELTIIGCSSSGGIDSNSAGGIVGAFAGANGKLICQSCWSTGEQTWGNCGGIVGGQAAYDSGNVEILNCYSTNTIYDRGGGIIGYECGAGVGGTGTVSINNCYSIGSINGTNAGGIVGNNAQNTTIINCYSTGDYISSQNGGTILGYDDTESYIGILIQHCYASGDKGGSTPLTGYIIGGTGTVPPLCYSEAANSSSGWNTSNAQDFLTGKPPGPTNLKVGSVWTELDTNVPYELTNMGYTPYTADIIDISGATPTLKSSFNQTINAGESTDPALVSSLDYELLGSYPTISIDNTTGRISTTSETAPGTYIIYVRNSYDDSIYSFYNISQFILTVNGSSSSNIPPTLLKTFKIYKPDYIFGNLQFPIPEVLAPFYKI